MSYTSVSNRKTSKSKYVPISERNVPVKSAQKQTVNPFTQPVSAPVSTKDSRAKEAIDIINSMIKSGQINTSTPIMVPSRDSSKSMTFNVGEGLKKKDTTVLPGPRVSTLEAIKRGDTIKVVPVGSKTEISPVGMAKKIVGKTPSVESSNPYGVKDAIKTIGEVAKTVARAPARAVTSVGLEMPAAILSLIQKRTVEAKFTPKTKLEKMLFGEEPIKGIFNEEQTAEKKSNEILTRLGFDKNTSMGMSLALAPLFVGGLKAVDLTPVGGTEKSAIKTLAKTTDESIVKTLLSKMGVADEIISKFSGTITKTTDEKVVKRTLDKIDELQKLYTSAPLKTASETYPKGSMINKVFEPKLTGPIEESFNNITKALSDAPKLKAKVATELAHGEKIQRIGGALLAQADATGETAAKKALEIINKEMPNAQFETIRKNVKQSDIDNLFNHINDSSALNIDDSYKAREGLIKVLEGRIPTNDELVVLHEVFPKELIDTILSKRSGFAKASSVGLETLNIPRSIMSSVDFSAPFRQGLFLINHPKRFFGAFPDMFKAFGSERGLKAVQDAIASKPTFELMRQNHLGLTEMGSILSLREEKFMSNYADKIPLVKASGRAYTAFLNKLRADVFEDLVLKSDKLGLKSMEPGSTLTKEIANFVNIATGRGNLGALKPAAEVLNAVLFSPKLIASRLTLLNPAYYIKADPFVRKEALKSLLTLAGAATTVLGIASMSGAEVETDPTSSDFAKIKIGNTRIDILGGFQQYLVAASRLLSGKSTSSSTGKVTVLGEGYKPTTRFDIIANLAQGKESPIASFVTDLLKGQDFQGKPITVGGELYNKLLPMTVTSLWEIYQDDPTLLPAGIFGAFGLGLQTYSNTNKSTGTMKVTPESTTMPKTLKLKPLKVPKTLKIKPLKLNTVK